MPGIDADDGQFFLLELGPQPGRRCAGLDTDTCNVWRMLGDKIGDGLGIGRNHSFPHDLACLIDNTHGSLPQ